MEYQMKRSISFHPGYELSIKSANNNTELQKQHIEEFIESKVDLLIVSPNQTEPLTTVIEKAFASGIPVILLDREAPTKSFTSFIGANNYIIGDEAARYVVDLNAFDSLHILHIMGSQGSSPAEHRRAGFDDHLLEAKTPHSTTYIQGNWYAEPLKAAIDKLPANSYFNVLYAHNDVMAAAANDLLRKKGFLDSNALTIGIDGLSSENGGLQLVANHELSISLLYPTGGEEAIETAVRVLEGKSVRKHIELPTVVIDQKNCDNFLAHAQKLKMQQKQVDAFDGLLAERNSAFDNQRKILYILVGGSFLLLVFGFLLYFNLRANKRKNALLVEQNVLRDKLIGVISHDSRAPLTSLLGVLQLFNSKDLAEEDLRRLTQELIKKTERVLSENESVIEWAKAQMQGVEVSLDRLWVKPLAEQLAAIINDDFKSKKIQCLVKVPDDLTINANEHLLKLTLKNLLVNAAKFSNSGGEIHIMGSVENGKGLVKVKDFGIGMDKESMKKLFRPDLASTRGTKQEKGTGLGLLQCYDFMKKMNGNITCESAVGKGTTFTLEFDLAY